MNKKSVEIRMTQIKQLLRLDIRCLQHCSLKERIAFLDQLNKCPKCSANLLDPDVQFLVPSFVMPCPFAIKSTLPNFSLLIHPTNGDYISLLNEPNGGDLHIGITSSMGEVFDYDSDGLKRNSNKWTDIPSILIKLNEDRHLDSQKWDLFLEKNWRKRDVKWNSKSYDEYNFNCLDFVVYFLNQYDFFNKKYAKINDENLFNFLKKYDTEFFNEKDILPQIEIKCVKSYLKTILSLNSKMPLII